MKVLVLEETGHYYAMLGLSLNKKQPIENMPKVAKLLAHAKGGGHNKFLESMTVYLDITAPRYFWSEFDTYRIGVTKQSESTMHTLKTDKITIDCFEKGYVYNFTLDMIKDCQTKLISGEMDIEEAKSIIPESWLQRRIVTTNYKAIKNIYEQRKNHKLPVWKEFCKSLLSQLEYKHYIVKEQ